MPVIISSYSSTNIQGKSSRINKIYLFAPGHGNEEEELKNTIDNDQIEESKKINKENAFRTSQKKSEEQSKKQSVLDEKDLVIRSTTTSSPESTSTTSPSSTTIFSSTTSPSGSTASSTTPQPASTTENTSGSDGVRDEVTTAEVITEYVEERTDEGTEERTEAANANGRIVSHHCHHSLPFVHHHQ